MKKNLIYNTIYQILILILPLITVPYVSRVLGAEGIGVYSYTYSIAYYFMIIAMLGLNNYGNRTIAKTREDKEKMSKEFCSIYVFQIIMATLMILLYALYVTICVEKYKTIAYIQIIYVISSLFDINWFFFGIEKFKLTITRNTIIKVLSLLLIFIFVKTPEDIRKYTLILSGSMLISNIILFSFLRKYVNFVKVGWKDIIKHFKPNVILFLPVVAVSIYKIMDKIMLGSLSSVAEVGYYENAEKIIQVPISIINALGTVMLPRVSNMISNAQEDNVKKLVKRTMPFVMFITIPMIFGLFCVSGDFATLYFGNGFEKSGVLIKYLSLTIVFLAWGNVIRTQYLIPKEKDRDYVISAVLGAIVNFVINWGLIPKYGAIGASFGTIMAEFVVALYQSIAVKKELELVTYMKDSVKFLVKAIIMFLFIKLIGNYIQGTAKKLVLQIILGSMIYGIMNIKYIYEELGVRKIISKLIGGN